MFIYSLYSESSSSLPISVTSASNGSTTVPLSSFVLSSGSSFSVTGPGVLVEIEPPGQSNDLWSIAANYWSTSSGTTVSHTVPAGDYYYYFPTTTLPISFYSGSELVFQLYDTSGSASLGIVDVTPAVFNFDFSAN